MDLPPVEIRLYETLEDITDRQWDELALRSPHATVFQKIAWLRSWWEVFGEARRLVLLAAYRGDRLVGAASFFAEQKRGLPADRATLRFVGYEHSDYQTFLTDPSDPGVMDALLDALERVTPPRGAAHLQEIPEESALAAALRARASRHGSYIRETDRTACPYLLIDADLANEPRSLKRHAKRLRQLGDIQVCHIRDADSILPHLSDFFEQHVRRWANTAFPSLFTRESNRTFYRLVTQRLADTGALLFTTVALNGQPCAYHFGFISGRHLLWYKPSFDVGLAKHSPGQFLLRELVGFAAREGLDRLDFTRGDEPFKRRVTSLRTYNASYALLARGRDRLWFDMRALGRRARDRIRRAFTYKGL